MQERGLITKVHKFSKYLTGISVMHLDEIQRVPAWLEATRTMVAIEIGKHGTKALGTCHEITVPVRHARIVEPRTYMANERTFLKWARMCFLALFVGMGLLGAQVDAITGIVLSACSLILLFRAYWVYRKRLRMIQEDTYESYFFDEYGPHMLMGLLVIPTITFLTFSLLSFW